MRTLRDENSSVVDFTYKSFNPEIPFSSRICDFRIMPNDDYVHIWYNGIDSMSIEYQGEIQRIYHSDNTKYKNLMALVAYKADKAERKK